jgi:hypothetical protein
MFVIKGAKQMTMEILKGHVSEKTAYLVDDYPFGFRLRCKIRYWIEYKEKKGFRSVSQTTNPRKENEVWNAPKYSTYCKYGMCMFLDEKKHVAFTGLTEYSSGEEAKAWQDTYIEGVPETGKDITLMWVRMKIAYDANRKKDDPLEVGIKEAFQALKE